MAWLSSSSTRLDCFLWILALIITQDSRVEKIRDDYNPLSKVAEGS
jgi:hypothetical protein